MGTKKLTGSARLEINGSPVFVDGPEAEGSARVNGRVWRWEFHRYLGPSFLRQDGELRKNQDPPRAVWRAFQRWLRRYLKRKDLRKCTA